MTTRRLRLAWRGADRGMRTVWSGGSRHWAIGWFRSKSGPRRHSGSHRADADAFVAVAGFAAGNVMLISIGIWAGRGAH